MRKCNLSLSFLIESMYSLNALLNRVIVSQSSIVINGFEWSFATFRCYINIQAKRQSSSLLGPANHSVPKLSSKTNDETVSFFLPTLVLKLPSTVTSSPPKRIISTFVNLYDPPKLVERSSSVLSLDKNNK